MATSQSADSQMQMSLINNLMQIQGLENSLIQQQPQQGQGNSPSNSARGASNAQQLVERQVKLAQLRQLQQLQNEIFRQQIALINGGSPIVDPFNTGLPTPGPSGEIPPQDLGNVGNFMEPLPNALMSTAPSRGGLNLQKQLQAISEGSSESYGRQLSGNHPATPSTSFQSPTSPQHAFDNHPPSPNTFGSGGPMSHPPSPATFGGSQYGDSYHVNHQHHQPYNTPIVPTPHSAPEGVAFRIYDGSSRRSLASSGRRGSLLDSSAPYYPPHQRPSHSYHLSQQHGRLATSPALSVPFSEDQDISPISSPWLGGMPSGAGNPLSGASHKGHRASLSTGVESSASPAKRLASSSDEDSSAQSGRRKSLARPKISQLGGEADSAGDRGANSTMTTASKTATRKPHPRSRSANSTPFLSSTIPSAPSGLSQVSSQAPGPSHHHNSISVSLSQNDASFSASGSASVPIHPTTSFPGAEDTPSPVDLGEALDQGGVGDDNTRKNPDSSVHTGQQSQIHPTRSDRSMPPPPLPQSYNGASDQASSSPFMMFSPADGDHSMVVDHPMVDYMDLQMSGMLDLGSNLSGNYNMEEMNSFMWPNFGGSHPTDHPIPATPGSIMNIKQPLTSPPQVPSNAPPMVPPPVIPMPSAATRKTASSRQAKEAAGSSAPSAATATPTTSAGGRVMRSRAQKNSTSGTSTGGLPTPSPGMKPILPAGTVDANGQLSASPMILPSSNIGSMVTGTVAGRKTSHKAAEQKRRDSLKTTFDDLRKLLPAIAASPDDANGDIMPVPLFLATSAPLLPGAKPPRGPPKLGDEGPNKGVSKLQLLICGNEFIRILKARVERRDEEIAKLRREVRLLREGKDLGNLDEAVDLEKDLDAIERSGFVNPPKDANRKKAGDDDEMGDVDDDDAGE